MRSRSPFIIAVATLALAFFLAAPSPVQAANWDWRLPDARYKVMNQFERAQYDKAAALFAAEDSAAAATEFEKFKVQFPDSPNLSYVIFMRGYSLHKAKQRNAAVKAYQEVTDYFADAIDDAVPALYFQGVAQMENGETGKGLRCMKSLIENPKYKKHSLTAGALRRLADNAWDNRKPDEAVTYWRQAVRDFSGINDEEASNALRNLTMWYIISKDYPSYETVVFADPASRDKPAHVKWVSENMWGRAWELYTGQFTRLASVAAAPLLEEQKAFYAYQKTTKPAYDKAGDTFGFFDRALQFQTRIYGEKEERERLLTEALAFVRAGTDKVKADTQLARLTDIMREGRLPEYARQCASAMTDRVWATYKEHEILADQGKWKEALEPLDQVEASPDAEWKYRAMSRRAWIYKDALGEYEKAIAIFEAINRPPGTLWEIQDAYKRWGKRDKAIGVLTEIENSFPDNASRAVWYKAAYYKEAGEKKLAVAQARRLLKAFPKSAEASPAHQMLEEYGVPIGGGVADE